VAKKQREYSLHRGLKRKCEECGEKYDVINHRQRFCKTKCYTAWHSKAKNAHSNDQRRNGGKYVLVSNLFLLLCS